VWVSTATTATLFDARLQPTSKHFLGKSSYRIDYLNDVVFSTGIHVWKIHVSDIGKGVSLGVRSGGYNKTCCYCSDGAAYDEFRNNLLKTVKFQAGSTITFRLELTGPGLLYARLNDLPEIKLCSYMKTQNKFTAPSCNEFTPVALLMEGSKVEFLGFV
jgi:hypothetical protein